MRLFVPVRVMPVHGVGGGMEHHTETLVRGLAGRGHRVTVLTTADPAGIREEEHDGVRFVCVSGTTWRRYRRGWWKAGYAELAARHETEPYDVLLTVSAGGLGYLVRARQELGLPIVALLHGSARGELLTAWRGARNARGLYRLGRAALRVPRLLLRWRRAAASVDHWIAVSPLVAEDAVRELSLARDRVTVVLTGVDVSRFRPDPAAREATRSRLDLPADAFVAIVASRLELEKGVHVLLDALALVRHNRPAARVLVAGEGRQSGRLRRQTDRNGLGEAVTFLGRVPHSELPALLAAADVFVLPSLGREGLPLSVVEAQACGLPTIASDTGGTSAALVDGVTGILVPPGRSTELARALEQLAASPELSGRMAVNARRCAQERFSETSMIDTIEAVLEAAAGLHPASPGR